ncbi:TolC family protein [Leptospira bandrabouensis]|uniref:TolC family protein n=2 Tax=Leptospira bandrabouensis TaxID=2484903 RepID=A0A6H3NU90_9LEPT|nr:TolC family protein [Leptospira bandrabouensis]TGN13629.1 TolC family protein [Leptospira bandrabouensis]
MFRRIICIMVIPILTVRSQSTEKLYLDVKKSEDVAIANSPELRLLGSQQRIKGLIVNENWRNYFPTASVSWFRNSNVVENEADSRSQRVSLNLDQVIYDGGRRKLALQAAMHDLDLSKYDLLLSINDLKFKTRNAYYTILSNKAQLELQERSIERQKEQLKFAQRELKLGDTTEVQVLQISNRLNEIQLQHKRTEIAYNTGLEEFKILLRLPSISEVILKDRIEDGYDFKFKSISEKDLVDLAFRSRVEFDRTKAAELQALSEHEIAKSYYIPTFSVGSYYASAGDRYEPRQREYGFNFKMSMALGPNTVQDTSNYIARNQDTDRALTSSTTVGIYDNLQYKRKIAQSGIAAEQAKITRRQLDDIIRIEVHKALHNYSVSWESMLLADENAESFDKRLKIKQRQVEIGEVRRVDLAETEIFYLEAQKAKINTRVQFLLSVSQLEMAVGASLDSLNLITQKKGKDEE